MKQDPDQEFLGYLESLSRALLALPEDDSDPDLLRTCASNASNLVKGVVAIA